MSNTAFIHSLELNEISDETTLKVLKLKAIAEEMGWKMDEYDAMDSNFYVTFRVSTKKTRTKASNEL